MQAYVLAEASVIATGRMMLSELDVGENRLALQQIKTITAEAAAVCIEHALGATRSEIRPQRRVLQAHTVTWR